MARPKPRLEIVVLDGESAQRVVARAEIEVLRPRAHRPRPPVVGPVDLVRFLLNEIGVGGEAARQREQEAAVFRKIGEQAFLELEPERQRLADELRILVGREHGAALRDAVGDHRLDASAEHHGGQYDREEASRCSHAVTHCPGPCASASR